MDKCQHCLFAAALASLFPVVFLVSDKQQSMIFHKPSTSAGTLNIKFANLQFLFGDCVKEIGLKVITEPSNSFYRQTIEMSEGERDAQSAQLYNGGRNNSNWQFQLAFASEKKVLIVKECNCRGQRYKKISIEVRCCSHITSSGRAEGGKPKSDHCWRGGRVGKSNADNCWQGGWGSEKISTKGFYGYKKCGLRGQLV